MTAAHMFIDIQGISKRFGSVQAVNDVSLRVSKGEILGFLGPNGAGKSTTMRIATGFLKADIGNVTVCGTELSADPVGCKRHIGYLPEGGPLYTDMTADGFLKFVGSARGIPKKMLEQRLDFVNDALHLSHVWYKPLDTLSKGYKRRVALAQALLHDPKILILDEPTDGLDPNQKREVHDLIDKMSAEKAVIISTHILEEAERLCSRAVMISGGHIVARGTIDEIRGRVAEAYTLKLTLSAPMGDGLKQSISNLRHIQNVSSARPCHVDLAVRQGKRVLADITELAAKEGITVERALEQVPGLQDAFHRLTSPQDALRIDTKAS